MTIDDMTANFALLDDWDDRYRYLIELGRTLEALPEAARTETNKVAGCVSQVWLVTDIVGNGAREPVLRFTGDSDAHIVRGLIAVLLAVFSGKPAREILEIDALALFERLGLSAHLTPQRSNGFKAMVGRIRDDARGVRGDPGVVVA
jgi:cysteine desulfuration protein SufE